MITNPNTLGLFDEDRRDRASSSTTRGALLYLDGANMNAILGITRPGDMGVDMMHYNPHKTFSGRTAAAAPARARRRARGLAPFLPAPLVVRDGDALPARPRPAEVDRPGARLLRQRRRPLPRVRYIRTLGAGRLKRVASTRC